jgi:hypothetical protein
VGTLLSVIFGDKNKLSNAEYFVNIRWFPNPSIAALGLYLAGLMDLRFAAVAEGKMAVTAVNRHPGGVVNKAGFAEGVKCRVFSAGFGGATWSIG